MNSINSAKNELGFFCDYIPLGQKFTIDEAVQKLAYYHNSNAEKVKRAFTNLTIHQYIPNYIIFRNGINNSSDCIVMEAFNSDGEILRKNAINPTNGNPQNRAA